jgi:hypothetical protein
MVKDCVYDAIVEVDGAMDRLKVRLADANLDAELLFDRVRERMPLNVGVRLKVLREGVLLPEAVVVWVADVEKEPLVVEDVVGVRDTDSEAVEESESE